MKIKSILSKYPRDGSYLIEIIHDLQNRSDSKSIDEKSMKMIAKYLNISIAQVYGVTTFYSMLYSKPQPSYIIRLCNSTVCHVEKVEIIENYLRELLEFDENGISKDGKFKLEEIECLGLCDMAPAMMINEKVYGNLNKRKIKDIIGDLK